MFHSKHSEENSLDEDIFATISSMGLPKEE